MTVSDYNLHINPVYTSISSLNAHLTHELDFALITLSSTSDLTHPLCTQAAGVGITEAELSGPGKLLWANNGDAISTQYAGMCTSELTA